MRLASISLNGSPHVAVKSGDEFVSLTLTLPGRPANIGDLLAIPDHIDLTRKAVDNAPAAARIKLADLEFRPAVARPGKIICLGLNYKDHAIELGKEFPDFPIIFLRGATSLTAHDQPIVLPKVSGHLDFEAELAVIIGKSAHHVSGDQTMEHVLGVTCFNDASVRDYQLKNPQITTGKNFDKTGGFGPEIVTLDELPAGPDNLGIVCRLNGATMQESNTNQHIFSVSHAIEILSSMMTLEPGDVIAFGTPGGVGMARRPPLWMKPGDICEIEIEGIGCLSNIIVAECEARS